MLVVWTGEGRAEAFKGAFVSDTFARVNGVPVPYRFVERRPGDVASCYADTTLAESVLGWKAQLSVERMSADAWRWQSGNPDGYI